MSVSKAVRQLLKDANLSYVDLANRLQKPPGSTNEKISRGSVDKQMLIAIAEITGSPFEQVNKTIEQARLEEKKEEMSDELIKNLEERCQIVEVKLLESNKLIEAKNKTIEILEKALRDKDDELIRANNLITRLYKQIDEL